MVLNTDVISSWSLEELSKSTTESMSEHGGPVPGLKLALNNYGMRQCIRYITTHTQSGGSVFGPEPKLLYRERTDYGVARTYAVSKVPAPLTAEEDLNSYLSDDGNNSVTSYIHGGKQIVIDDGVAMVCVDMGPRSTTSMHRTVSIDFVIVTEGEIELEVDSGEKKILHSGVCILFLSSSAWDMANIRYVDKDISRIRLCNARPCTSGPMYRTANRRGLLE